MIAFEVHVDGKLVCTAGVGDLGVITTIISWAQRKASEHEGRALEDREFEEDLTIHVGGLLRESDGTAVHLRWLDTDLQPGSEVVVRVVEVTEATKPSWAERESPDFVEEQKRRYYEHLKQEYGD